MSAVTIEEALGQAIKLSHEHNTPFDVLGQTLDGPFSVVRQAEVPNWEDGGWKTLASVSYQSYAIGSDAKRCANFIVRDYTAFGPSAATYTKGKPT